MRIWYCQIISGAVSTTFWGELTATAILSPKTQNLLKNVFHFSCNNLKQTNTVLPKKQTCIPVFFTAGKTGIVLLNFTVLSYLQITLTALSNISLEEAIIFGNR